MMNLEDVNLLNSSSTAEKKTKVKNIPITSAASSSSMDDPKVASSASEVAARTVNAVGPIIKFHDHDDANGAQESSNTTTTTTTKRSSGLLTATTSPKRSSRTLKRQEWFTQRAEEDYERRFDIQNKYSVFEKQSSERGLLLGFGGSSGGGAVGGGSGAVTSSSNGKHHKRVGSKSRTSTTTTTTTSYTGASMRSVTSTHSAPSPSPSTAATHINNNNSNIIKTPRSVGGLFKRNRISSGSSAGGTNSSTSGVTIAAPLTTSGGTRGRFGIRGGTHASTQTLSTIQSNDSRNTSSSHAGAIPPPPFFSSTSTGGDPNANAAPPGFMSLPHRRQVSSDSFDNVLGNDDAAEPPDTLPFTSTTHSTNATERGNRQRRRNATYSPTNQNNRSILTSNTSATGGGSPILPLDTTKPRRLRSVAKQFGTKILGQIATVVQATSDGMEGIISFYQGGGGDRNGLLNKRRSVALRKRKQEPPALILSDLTRPLEDFALYTKAQLIADDTIEFRKLQQALRERRRRRRIHHERGHEDDNHNHKKRHPKQSGRVSEQHHHHQNDNDMSGIMMPVTDMGVRYCLHELKMLNVGCQNKRNIKIEKLRQEELKRQREERQKQLEDQRRNILLQQRALAQSQMQQSNLDCPTTPTTLRRHLTAPYSPTSNSTNRSAAHTVAAVVADAVGQSTRNLFGSRKDNHRNGAGVAGCGDLMEDFSHPRCRPIPTGNSDDDDDDEDDVSASSPPMTPPTSTRKQPPQRGSSSSSARRLATSPRLETYEAAAAAAYEAAVEDDSKETDNVATSRTTTRRVATPPDSSTTLEAAAQAVYATADDDEVPLQGDDDEKDDQADMLAAMERQNHQNCNEPNFLNVQGDTPAIPKWRTRRNTQKHNLKHMQRIPSPSPPTSPEAAEHTRLHQQQQQYHRRELPQLNNDDDDNNDDDNLSHLSSDGSCLEVDFSPQIRKERALLLAQGQRGGKKFQVERHISEGKAYVDGLGSPQPTTAAGHESPPQLPLPPFVSSSSHATTTTPLKDNVSRNIAATSTQPAPPLSPLRDDNHQTPAVPLSPSYSSSHISDTDTSASGAARRSSSIDSLRSLGSHGGNPNSSSTTSSPTRQSRRLRKSKRPPSSSQAQGIAGRGEVASGSATTASDTSKHTKTTTKPTSFDPHSVGQLDVEFGHRSMPLEHIHTTTSSNNHPNNVANADTTSSSSHPHHRMHHSMPLSFNDSVLPIDQNSLSFPTTEENKSRQKPMTAVSNSHHHHHGATSSGSNRHHYSHRRTTGHHHSSTRTSELSDYLHQHSSLDARRRRHTGNHVLHTSSSNFDHNTTSMTSSGEPATATATNTATTTAILNK